MGISFFKRWSFTFRNKSCWLIWYYCRFINGVIHLQMIYRFFSYILPRCESGNWIFLFKKNWEKEGVKKKKGNSLTFVQDRFHLISIFMRKTKAYFLSVWCMARRMNLNTLLILGYIPSTKNSFSYLHPFLLLLCSSWKREGLHSDHRTSLSLKFFSEQNLSGFREN